MSTSDSGRHTVLIFARDEAGRPLEGVDIGFAINSEDAGGVPYSEGRASIEVPDGPVAITVTATYCGESQSRDLAPNVRDYTFTFARTVKNEDKPSQTPHAKDS